jgi:hypothetical protein
MSLDAFERKNIYEAFLQQKETGESLVNDTAFDIISWARFI